MPPSPPGEPPLLELPLPELPVLELPLLEVPLLEPPASLLVFTASMPPQAARHTPAASIAKVRPLMISLG
jgi:hypothetical protein